jgi:hypothetical protein
MIKGMLIAMGLGVASIANSATTNFSANTDGTFVCTAYCTGYTSDAAGMSVDSVSLVKQASGYYTFSAGLNGRIYTARALNAIPSVLFAGDGTYILASVGSDSGVYHCNRSGRVTVCVTTYSVYSGKAGQ